MFVDTVRAIVDITRTGAAHTISIDRIADCQQQFQLAYASIELGLFISDRYLSSLADFFFTQCDLPAT
jgi:hypothetical protein